MVRRVWCGGWLWELMGMRIFLCVSVMVDGVLIDVLIDVLRRLRICSILRRLGASYCEVEEGVWRRRS